MRRIRKANYEARTIKKAVLASLNIDVSVSVSVTDYGTSLYIQDFEGWKVRISDHAVENLERMFGEIHFSLHTWERSNLIEVIERRFFPERFETLKVKTFNRVDSFFDFDKLEDFNPERGTITKVNEWTTRKGKKKYRVHWYYMKESFYTATRRI